MCIGGDGTTVGPSGGAPLPRAGRGGEGDPDATRCNEVKKTGGRARVWMRRWSLTRRKPKGTHSTLMRAVLSWRPPPTPCPSSLLTFDVGNRVKCGAKLGYLPTLEVDRCAIARAGPRRPKVVDISLRQVRNELLWISRTPSSRSQPKAECSASQSAPLPRVCV